MPAKMSMPTKPAASGPMNVASAKHDADRKRRERGQRADEGDAEQRRRQRQRLALGRGDRLDEADFGARIGLALLDELVDELTDGTFRRLRSGIGRLEHQSSSSSSWSRRGRS